MTQRRRQILINKQIQYALMGRVAVYLVSCLMFIVLPITLYRSFQDPEILLTSHLLQVLADYSAVFLSSLVLIPCTMYDMLKLSHRFVGPVVRIRNEMTRMAAGEKVDAVVLRENDYWQDLASVFNEIVYHSQQDADTAKSADERPTASSRV